MDNFDQQFQKQGKRVSLLKAEKDQILNRILATPLEQPKKPSSLSFFSIFLNAKFAVTAGLALLIVASIPVTYAAQKSGPGDLLHGFELSVVEPLEHIAQFSPDAKVAYSTHRLEERLDELQDAPKGQITQEQIAIASENIQGYVNEALVVDPESPKKEVISHFVKVSALLNAHEDVIADTKQADQAIAAITDQVEGRLDDQVEEYAEDQTPGELAQTVQQEVKETTEILNDQTEDMDTMAIARQLEEARKEVSQGDLEEALQEVIDAKVQALAQDYTAPDDEQAEP